MAAAYPRSINGNGMQSEVNITHACLFDEFYANESGETALSAWDMPYGWGGGGGGGELRHLKNE